MTEANARAVAGICVRLEGLPLAIELAAARARILPPDKLLDRLSSRLGLLTGGASDRDPRQQTLRGAIAWSHDLLPPDQQAFFRRFAAFAGGATFETIEAVANHDAHVDGLDSLEALVQQSLIRQVDGPDGEPRFVMLEMIREFAHERLEESGEAAAIRECHSAHFLSLAEFAEPALTGPEQARYLDWLEAEHDNLRAALGWYEQQGSGPNGLRLAGALWRFWWVRGHLTEGRTWLTKMIESTPNALDANRAKALDAAGALACAQGDLEAASRLHESALIMFRQLDDTAGLARVYGNLGIVAHYQNELELAELQHEISLALYRSLGDTRRTADVLGYVGALAFVKENLEQAAQLYEEALSLYLGLNDEQGLAYSLANLGEVRQHQGNTDQAERLYQQALMALRRLGDRQTTAFVLHGLSGVVLATGNVAGAGRHAQESLDIRTQIGDWAAIAESLEGVAAACAADGMIELAARLFGAAEAERESNNMPLSHCYLDDHRCRINELTARLGDQLFAAAWTDGRTLDTEQAVAEALAVRF